MKLWFKLNLNNVYYLQPADTKSFNFYFKIQRYKIDCCMHMYILIKDLEIRDKKSLLLR